MTELAAWLVAAALILVNAGLAGSEIAFVSLPSHRLDGLRERGRRGRRAARLVGDPDRYLSTVQIGITLVGFLASATAAVSSADAVAGALGFLGDAAEPVAVVLLTLLVGFLALVLGELVPKRIALANPEGWALRAAGPIDLLARLLGPAVWIASRTTDAVLLVLNAGRTPASRPVAEEIEQMLRLQRGLSPEQREVIGEALAVGDRRIRAVLVPRRDVVGFPAELPAGDALPVALASGHSRFPVYEGDLDRTVGVVHLADLVSESRPVGTLAREAPTVPETATVLTTLRELQDQARKLAIVADEYGGVEGIVTVEDLVEELVGEIYDERDRHRTPVRRDAAGVLHAAGSLALHDLNDHGVALPAGDAVTLGGFVVEQLGRLPRVGDRVTAGGWILEVEASSDTAVDRVSIRPQDLAPGE